MSYTTYLPGDIGDPTFSILVLFISLGILVFGYMLFSRKPARRRPE